MDIINRNKEKVGTIKSKLVQSLRLKFFITGLFFVIIGFISKGFYRPYAYSNILFDIGFADSAPSFFYVVGFSLLLSTNSLFKASYVITVVTLGSVLYEFYQSFDNSPFDTSDTIYSIIGGGTALLVQLILKKTKHNNVYTK